MAGDALDLAKSAMRAEARARLAALTPAATAAASERIAAAIEATPQWQGARVVMGYLPIAGEVDLRALLERGLLLGKTVCVPRVDWAAARMEARAIERLGEIPTGPRGVAEPGPATRRVEAGEIDLVLTPGLAFDEAGGRLGRGGGFYDRFLWDVSARCAVIGVCFGAQVVDAVPMAAHDARMRLLASERGVIPCRGASHA